MSIWAFDLAVFNVIGVIWCNCLNITCNSQMRQIQFGNWASFLCLCHKVARDSKTFAKSSEIWTRRWQDIYIWVPLRLKFGTQAY